MTCRECARWAECSKKDGTTKYYGKDNCAGNAERLCRRFRSQREEKFKFEIWRKFQKLFLCLMWVTNGIQWLALFNRCSVIAFVCVFVVLIFGGGCLLCGEIYKIKLYAAIKKEFDKEKNDG